LLAPKGMIAWHDYAAWAPEVVQALDEMLPTLPMVHLSGTSLAIHCADPDRASRWQFEWVRKDLFTEMESHLQTLNISYQQLKEDYQRVEKRFDELEKEHDEVQEQFLRLQEDHQQLQERNHDLRVRRDEMRTRMEEAVLAQQNLTRFWGLVR